MTEATQDRYPEETFDDEYTDDGTMPENVQELREAIVGRKIVNAEKEARKVYSYGQGDRLKLTLDNGKVVYLSGTGDCCAYTSLEGFWRDPSSVEHVITGVGTTEGYEKWHIYADLGDIMELDVSWSSGNPFYYGYGFEIVVEEQGA